MSIPIKLPIVRLEDYHTHHLGKCRDGRLFWAYETFSYNVPRAERIGNDWHKTKKHYAILHIFSTEGDHVETKYIIVDSSIAEERSLEEEVESLVAELGDIEYEDIEVKLFETVIEGITFGLIADEDTEMVNLQPSSTISFQEPWDGEYYT